MLAAAADPDGVRRLVLVNAVGVSSRWLAPLHEAGLARLRAQGNTDAAERLAAMGVDALHQAVPDVHADYTQAYFPAWFVDPAFARSVMPPRALSATGAHVVSRLRRDGYDWTARLRALRADTLVLHGSDDVLPLDEAANTARVLAEAGVSVAFRPLAGAGHNPFWEAPTAFFTAVHQFLAA
jgi:proline iminopeptidase